MGAGFELVTFEFPAEVLDSKFIAFQLRERAKPIRVSSHDNPPSDEHAWELEPDSLIEQY